MSEIKKAPPHYRVHGADSLIAGLVPAIKAVGVGALFLLSVGFVNAEVLQENFDSSISDASAFGFYWDGAGNDLSNNYVSSATTTPVSSPYSLYKGSTNAGGIAYAIASSSVGVASVWVKADIDGNSEGLFFRLGSSFEAYSELAISVRQGGGIECGSNGEETLTTFEDNTWYELLLEWKQSNGETIGRCGVRSVGTPLVYSEYRGVSASPYVYDYGEVSELQLYTNAPFPYIALDNFYFATDADYDLMANEGTSGIISIDYPTFATTTSSTTIDVEYTYRNTDGYNGAKLFLRHQKNGTTYTLYDFLDEEVTSGIGEKTIELLADGAYTLQINLCDIPEAGTPDCMSFAGESTIFYAVVSDGGIQEVITAGYADYVIYPPESCHMQLNPFASSTFVWTDCVGYMFTPSTTTLAMVDDWTLDDKFPFAYAYDVPQMVSALFQTSADSSASVAMDVNGWQITFISQDLIASVPFVGLIKVLLAAFLYIITALTIYRKIIKSFDTQTA